MKIQFNVSDWCVLQQKKKEKISNAFVSAEMPAEFNEVIAWVCSFLVTRWSLCPSKPLLVFRTPLLSLWRNKTGHIRCWNISFVILVCLCIIAVYDSVDLHFHMNKLGVTVRYRSPCPF